MKNIVQVMNSPLSQNNIDTLLFDAIINDVETKMRIGIKAVEESVKDESKQRRMNAPLTTEERALLSI